MEYGLKYMLNWIGNDQSMMHRWYECKMWGTTRGQDKKLVDNNNLGNQVPFSSINYGTDTSPEGRLIIKSILEAIYDGVGKNKTTAIFPISIFKVKNGINRYAGDRNHDLYMLAKKVCARRFFPNFLNLDSPFNFHEKWNIDDPERYKWEVSTMGCRTRVFDNIHGEKTSLLRGNASFTSVNIVRLAIEASKRFDDIEHRVSYFYEILKQRMQDVREQLIERFRVQQSAEPRQFPYVALQMQEVKEDTMKKAMLQHTLSIGFNGLAECLVALIGEHHGQSDEAQELGLRIVRFMASQCNRFKHEDGLNFALLATPAEGLSHKFTDSDKKRYGVISGVTDKGFYTNSNHIPVEFEINPFRKAELESPYHAYTLAGHIFYTEMDGNPEHNLEAIDKIIEHAMECGAGYISINQEDNTCSCGYEFKGKIYKCPKCGSEDLLKIARITGYLVGNTGKWNRGKLSELKERVSHV